MSRVVKGILNRQVSLVASALCARREQALKKIVIFGNSGSGKSTLAKIISDDNQLPVLDLDTIAWKPASPPERMELAKSKEAIDAFISSTDGWVIEGCYSDLLEIVVQSANEVIFLDLPVDYCVMNAQARPWEPHKYASKEAQDANLKMLIDWISQYPARDDVFSRNSHMALFEHFPGKKTRYTCNEYRS